MPENKETILSAIAGIKLRLIAGIKLRLEEMDKKREQLLKDLESLQYKLYSIEHLNTLITASLPTVNAQSTPQQKISLFHSLFRGREDVYSRLWISKKTGAKGYSPVCENEWINSICKKPAVKCSNCENRKFSQLTDDVIQKHLNGNITIGVYPLLQDETCYFLAIDFDKETWQDDVKAFMGTCKQKGISAFLERSRSGNGGHVWIFFAEPVSAGLARQMGTFLITETMNQRHQLDMKSYDRLFPNQDTLPKGGFGNLIALPLQKIPIENGNSVFIDENFIPYADQWVYLSSVKKMTRNEIQLFMDNVTKTEDILEEE
jgi:hypothetical protein